VGLGLALAFCVVPLVTHYDPLLGGWVGMTGIALFLHFGIAHLLSLWWRRWGIDARPIMRSPVLATSLSDFWGRRWNLAFRDVAYNYVFRPLVEKLGGARATLAVFLVSGLVHDLVISLPAGGGWGLPTLYFLLQGSGVLFERSRLGKRLGLGKGVVGRLFCVAIVVGPVALLFHRPFVERVVLPMLTTG
jgi:D-alanyl-lipoteichoic acid acyltransferase DltB (MBOAT superfamily)